MPPKTRTAPALTGTGTTAGGKDKLLGVPADYSVPATEGDFFRPGGAVQVGDGFLGAGVQVPGGPRMPLYHQTDGNAILDMTVEDTARLQAQMAAVGLIGPSTQLRLGMADAPTRSAWTRLLTYANTNALTYQQALDGLAANPPVRPDGKPTGLNAGAAAYNGPTKNVTKTEAILTDPITARATARDAVRARLGRDPTDAEYKGFIANLHRAEGGQDVTTTVTTPDANGHDSTTQITHQDDTTDPSAATLADQMTRTGAMGREANTKMVNIDYYAAMMKANQAGGGMAG